MPIYTIISYTIYSELFILTRNLFPHYLQGGYPARLKKVLIVTAPLWFKAPFKILRLFVREKLRERVFTVSVPQLSLHVPRKALPVHLGGTLEIDHATWLLTCRASMTNREDELLANIVAPGPAAATPLSNGGGGGGGGSSSTSSNSNNDTNSSSAVSSAASSSNINGATAAATIISAVHQLAESNTTVVTVGTAAAGIESTTQSTSTQQQQSTEPNENITINGLSPSHRLKLNTSGIQQQQQQLQQPINGDSTTASTAAAAGSVAALNGSAATAAGAGAGAGAGVAAAAAGAAAAGGSAGEFWTENPPSSASSGFSDDDSLAGQEGDPKTIEQIVQMVRERCRQGLVKEYADIRNRAPEGTFLHAR